MLSVPQLHHRKVKARGAKNPSLRKFSTGVDNANGRQMCSSCKPPKFDFSQVGNQVREFFQKNNVSFGRISALVITLRKQLKRIKNEHELGGPQQAGRVNYEASSTLESVNYALSANSQSFIISGTPFISYATYEEDLPYIKKLAIRSKNTSHIKDQLSSLQRVILAQIICRLIIFYRETEEYHYLCLIIKKLEQMNSKIKLVDLLVDDDGSSSELSDDDDVCPSKSSIVTFSSPRSRCIVPSSSSANEVPAPRSSSDDL